MLLAYYLVLFHTVYNFFLHVQVHLLILDDIWHTFDSKQAD